MSKIHASMNSTMDIHVSCTDIDASCMKIRANEAWIIGPGRAPARIVFIDRDVSIDADNAQETIKGLIKELVCMGRLRAAPFRISPLS